MFHLEYEKVTRPNMTTYSTLIEQFIPNTDLSDKRKDYSKKFVNM